MDPEEFRSILSRSRVGIWELIEAAIKVASSDHGEEFHSRRDKIVESLYAPAKTQLCRKCNCSLLNDGGGDLDEPYYLQAVGNNFDINDDINSDQYDDDGKKLDVNNKRDSNGDFSKSPLTPDSNHPNISGEEEDEEEEEEEEEELDPHGGLFDDEQTKILSIKEQLGNPHKSGYVLRLLRKLADMDITFEVLKETDIGRHVNRLRKHPSKEVRKLVKQLVRKWKDIVDEWVRLNDIYGSSDLIADEDSPQQNMPRNQENVNHQVPDFGYSPNPQNGSSSVERNFREQHETKPKTPKSEPKKEVPSVPKSASAPPNVPDFGYSPNQQNGSSSVERNFREQHETKPKTPKSEPKKEVPSVPKSASAPPNRAPKESVLDDAKLNSARRRLQENYQEAQNAKRQRTIQVMDIHEIPKPKAKNAFIAKNKGSGFQGRQHR